MNQPLQILSRRKLQATYAHPTCVAAKSAIKRLHKELTALNVSAAGSLEEGLHETLTLHCLGVVDAAGMSFKATNLIENVMPRFKERCRELFAGGLAARNCAGVLRRYSRSKCALNLRRIDGCAELLLFQLARPNKLHLAPPAAA